MPWPPMRFRCAGACGGERTARVCYATRSSSEYHPPDETRTHDIHVDNVMHAHCTPLLSRNFLFRGSSNHPRCTQPFALPGINWQGPFLFGCSLPLFHSAIAGIIRWDSLLVRPPVSPGDPLEASLLLGPIPVILIQIQITPSSDQSGWTFR